MRLAGVLACSLMLAGAVPLRAETWFPVVPAEAVRPGDLTAADLEAGFTELDSLGAFFGAFADRETNALARDRWRRLSVNYRETAERLRRLREGGELVIGDLRPGEASLLSTDGRLVLDRDLDGRWPHGDLLPVLLQTLAQRYPPQDWPWLADHLRAAGGLATLAEDPRARPLLARFFQAKDAYLWLAMQRIAQGDPARRQALARRQVVTFNAIPGLRDEMAAAFGPGPADRLQQDWATYVAQVDGFAATRGWLLLDPALRLTQLGAAAKEDAVDLAAARVVAEAPRSAVAAAWAERERLAQTSRAPAGPARPAAPGSPLSEVAAQAQQDTALAALRADVAEREAELAAVREEVSALRTRVGELNRSLAASTSEAARLEETLAVERARLAAVEGQAAEQAALAKTLAARMGELSALDARMTELEALLALRDEEAQRLEAALAEERARLAEAEAVESPAAPTVAGGEAALSPPRSGALQFYIAAAIVVIFVMALLLWWRQRRRGQAAQTSQTPLQLTSPAQDAAAMPRNPVIDVAEAPAAVAEAEPNAAPSFSMPPNDARIRVSAAVPPTPEAQAAIRAGAAKVRAASTVPEAAPKGAPEDARRVAARATGQPGVRGQESAAATHPIVQALRKGNLPLFELLFAEMTGLRAPQLQHVAYGGQGEHLLLACRAVDVDKVLFGTIFLLTDSLRGGDADDDPARAAEVLRMYDRMPSATAQEVLAKWRRTPGGEMSPPEETSLG